ncbi:MAG: AMP-binding protein [Rickettsiales bacterium]|jgi:acyl-[acyl-carrier-protein]-phospholipid O-acyltransferase/long-chain-fatty-acid--[acyl-carrier-protein] ligase|nr:AMP-binding protein [Rickettsiales bacterium]
MYKFAKLFLRGILGLCFKIRFVNKALLKSLGSRAVFLTSNMSTLDPLLLMAYLPGRPVFAMSAGTYRGWVKIFLRWADVFIIDSSNPLSLKVLTETIKNGRWAVILAEGRVSESGMVAKVYEAPGLIAENSGAVIVPVQINGVQFSYFSRIGVLDKRPFPRITVTFLEGRRVAPSGAARESRESMGDYIYRQMQEAFYLTRFDRDASIFANAMQAAKLYGHNGLRRAATVEDSERKPKSYRDVLVRSFALAGGLNKIARRGDSVGIMLPNSIDDLCVLLALSAYERTPAMLNFSSGEKNILNCCKMALVRAVVTSRKFVAAIGIEKVVESLERENVRIVYLEDLAARETVFGRIAAIAKYKWKYVPYPVGGKDRKGVVLFTSGSEGMPKAVALSHYNIMSSVCQTVSMLSFGPSDTWFNALPMFHSFGLTVCTLAPFMVGAKIFMYPTPLHYRVIPEICYSIGATVMAGTNTFLKNYAKHAHPYDFATLRILINGAEILRDDTKALWMEKFGVRVIQGYGATETSPLITINSPAYNRSGSIGKFPPGIEYRLKKLDGVAEGGELVVKGDNVMMGYMKLDNPGVVVPPKDGWYETGDVVYVDADGYVFIKDRIKRFAKIAGEMVSLTNVESLAKEAFASHDDLEVAAVAIPHETKGEQVVLAATMPGLDLSVIAEYAKRQGIYELYVPKAFMHVDAIPILKTGKRDYAGLRALVMEKLGGKA